MKACRKYESVFAKSGELTKRGLNKRVGDMARRAKQFSYNNGSLLRTHPHNSFSRGGGLAKRPQLSAHYTKNILLPQPGKEERGQREEKATGKERRKTSQKGQQAKRTKKEKKRKGGKRKKKSREFLGSHPGPPLGLLS